MVGAFCGFYHVLGRPPKHEHGFVPQPEKVPLTMRSSRDGSGKGVGEVEGEGEGPELDYQIFELRFSAA